MNDPNNSPPPGTRDRAYRDFNATLRCTAPGCTANRDRSGLWCRPHYRRFLCFGSFDRRHIPGDQMRPLRARIDYILGDPRNARHQEVLAAMQALDRAWSDWQLQDRPEMVFLRRLVDCEVDPKDVLVVTAAAYAWAYQYDMVAYEDADYMTAQLARLLLRLAPAARSKGGRERSLRRSRALVGLVIDATGPAVALLISTLTRERRQREAAQAARGAKSSSQQPAQPLQGTHP